MSAWPRRILVVCNLPNPIRSSIAQAVVNKRENNFRFLAPSPDLWSGDRQSGVRSHQNPVNEKEMPRDAACLVLGFHV